jgi:hypothetical protein
VALAAAALTAVVAWVVVLRPDLLRLTIAAAFVAMALALAARRPAAGALVTLLALPFEALVRRLLIAQSGLPSRDPLILVGPAVAIVLCFGLFVVRRRPLATDGLSKLMLAFVALSALELANPGGGGLVVGLGGLLFLSVPLLWFFLGRELGSAALVRTLLTAMIAVAAAVGVYGLAQAQVGLPAWDRAWVQLNGYAALNVGQSIRAFGTFSSNAEYALWLAGALAVACALALTGRGRLVLAVPLLVTALLLASVRSALLLAFLAVAVAIGLRSRSVKVAVVVVILALGLGYGALRAYGGAAANASAGNALLARQVGGITNPFDANDSTLGVHIQMLTGGVQAGLRSPLGSGPGAVNLAGAKLGGEAVAAGGSTEIDVSNAFVALGLPGGLLFLAILVAAFRGVGRRYLRGEPLALAVLALLVVMLGQWLIGGLYALLPLFWFLLGWASAPPEAEPAR